MPNRRRFPRFSLAACLAALILALSVPALHAQDAKSKPEAPSGKAIASATVRMTFGQGAFLIGGQGGNGTLTFKGKTNAFRIGGLGVGGLGVSKVTAEGEVYNLEKVSDFPGAFFQARAGYTAVEGKGHLWLENSNGVVLKLRAKTKGLGFSLGVDGLLVEMGAQKKSDTAKSGR